MFFKEREMPVSLPVLETQRLILRAFRQEDAEDMYHHWAPDPKVTKYLTWPAYTSVKDAVNRIQYLQDNGVMTWAMVQVIGSIGTDHVYDAQAETGYCLGTSWWNQGYMTEAMNAVIHYFLYDMKIDTVTACHDVRNPASGRVMQKCGMTCVGIFPGSGHNNLGISDEVRYIMTKDSH